MKKRQKLTPNGQKTTPKWQKPTLIIIAVLLVVLLIGPFLIPVPPLEGTRPENELADADSKFIEANGLTIHYKEQGSGAQTFILLHGFGASVFSWQQVMPPFAELGRVIAYDRPAFGLTSRPMPGAWSGESPYSLEANVALLGALMDAWGVQKAVLVANSAGSAVTVSFALAHPERVEALILVDPALGNSSRFPAWAAPLLASPQLRHLGPLLVRNIASSGDETIKTSWHDPAKITPETFAGYRTPLQAHNWDRALYEFTIASRASGLDNRLTELTLPVLLITGDDDRIVPTEQTVALLQKFASAQLVIIPETGHVPHEEKPAEFMQAIRDFLFP